MANLTAAYLAENPGNGFDALIAPDGVRARSSDGAWQVGLALVAVGRDGAMKEAAPAGVEARGNRAELHRGALTEWYVNDERGLEQGFTLKERQPADGGGELVLALELTGDLMPLVAGNGRRLDLLRPGHPLPVLHYNGLSGGGRRGAGAARPGWSSAPRPWVRVAGCGSWWRTQMPSSSDGGSAAHHRGLELPRNGHHTEALRGETGTATVTSTSRWGTMGSTGVRERWTRPTSSFVQAWESVDIDNTYSMAWGDWDGDGDLDLAAANFGAATECTRTTASGSRAR